MKRLFAWILVLTLALCLPAMAEQSEMDLLIVGMTTAIETANRSEYNFDVLSGTLAQLAPVRLDGENVYQPLLCDFDTEDYRIWTLTVKEGMTWHDGEPVTASDIRFTLEYLSEIEEGGYAADYENIEVLDERAIRLTLPRANVRFLSNLTTLRIIPEHIYKDVPAATTLQWTMRSPISAAAPMSLRVLTPMPVR